jgi:hypothetical protein
MRIEITYHGNSRSRHLDDHRVGDIAPRQEALYEERPVTRRSAARGDRDDLGLIDLNGIVCERPNADLDHSAIADIAEILPMPVFGCLDVNARRKR